MQTWCVPPSLSLIPVTSTALKSLYSPPTDSLSQFWHQEWRDDRNSVCYMKPHCRVKLTLPGGKWCGNHYIYSPTYIQTHVANSYVTCDTNRDNVHTWRAEFISIVIHFDTIFICRKIQVHASKFLYGNSLPFCVSSLCPWTLADGSLGWMYVLSYMRDSPSLNRKSFPSPVCPLRLENSLCAWTQEGEHIIFMELATYCHHFYSDPFSPTWSDSCLIWSSSFWFTSV